MRNLSSADGLRGACLVLFAFVLLGCSAGGNRAGERVKQPAAPPTAAAPTAGSADAVGGARLPTGGVACTDPSCVYHAGAGAYFTCLSFGDGSCFHYGRACAPQDSCMLEQASGRYRQCTELQESRCARFGEVCEPAKRCYYNSADRRHHVCEEARDGACIRYGAACEP